MKLTEQKLREIIQDEIKSLNEASAAKLPRGMDNFAKEMNEEGMTAEIFEAEFDGGSFKAQSTDKVWDGYGEAPVTKYFSRGGYKSISPKGTHYIIETDKFWYFVIGRTWYAVKRESYATPPFEY